VGMRKKLLFLWCVWWGFQMVDLKAQAIAQPKLKPAEWWTASYDDVFNDAGARYYFNAKEAYEVLDILIERATQDHLPKWAYKAYRQKGFYQEQQLAFQAALNNYILAAKVIENIDRQFFADIQIYIAITYRSLYQYPEARNVYLSLIEHCLKYRDSSNLVHAQGGLGLLFFTVNDTENAIRYYNKALNATRELGDHINECIYLDNLAEAYGTQKKFKTAFEHIELACQIAVKQKDIESEIPLYERYARLHAECGDLDKAFEKINKGLQLCNAGNFTRDRNNLTIVKAELYLKQQEIDSALAAFKSINEKSIHVNSLIKVYYELGKIYEQKKEIELAENYFTKSHQLADKNQFLRYNEWSHRALYRIYRLKNQSKEALIHLECANTLRDSLFNYEKSGQVTELQFRYDLAHSEQQLQEVQFKANRNKMLVGALVGLLIITFLVFGYYFQRKQNEMLTLKNEAIRLQKEQLEAFNQEILTKNQAIEAKNQAIEAQKQLLEVSNVMLQQSKEQLETFNHEILTKNQAIEAQKQLLETSNGMLQQSNGMLQQFNYAVAHDLREPLRNISSFVMLIQRRYLKDLPPVAISYFEFVTTGATRMSKMLEGLLKYSMLTMNQVTDLEVLNVRDVVNEVKDSLRLISEEKKAKIVFPDAMPKLYINKIHLTQLIQNLVSNALKFVTREPIIEIGSQEVDDKLLLFIKDNGIGIHPESGKKLFNLFHRLHRDSSQFEGTGVGLALCKNIVEKYGGKIWFESIENEGTTFWMQFPK
jgi:signal transduction histidine kinase